MKQNPLLCCLRRLILAINCGPFRKKLDLPKFWKSEKHYTNDEFYFYISLNSSNSRVSSHAAKLFCAHVLCMNSFVLTIVLKLITAFPLIIPLFLEF